MPLILMRIREGETTMLVKTVTQVGRSPRWQRIAMLAALLCAAALCPAKSEAQITGNLEADIPFQFHAGNAKLPAGKYTIRRLEDSDETVLEISSADGRVSALFNVEPAQANGDPAKSELIFNKYGNRYFLSQLFDEGSTSGSKVVESRYEKRVSQASATGQEHVSAKRRAQQGK